MKINAVFCKKCHCIIHSRYRHDYVSCNCKSASIDGGFTYTRVIGNQADYIHLQLRAEKYLEFMMYMDYRYGNHNSKDFPNGYYGKFIVNNKSNLGFYKKLIENYKDVGEILDEIIKR